MYTLLIVRMANFVYFASLYLDDTPIIYARRLCEKTEIFHTDHLFALTGNRGWLLLLRLVKLKNRAFNEKGLACQVGLL